MNARRALGVVSAAALVAVALALAPAVGLTPTTGSDPDDSQALFSVTPCSVFDSRPNQGGDGKFAADEARPVTLGGTAECPDVPAEATGFLVSIIAIGAEGNGSVKAWPTSEAEPAAGGVLAFSADEFAPANTVFVADGGDPDDVTVKVLSNPANVKVVLLGYSLGGTAVYESLDRTIVVPAGGTDLENGTALTDAIAAAGGATPSAEDPVTVLLQPGRYDLGGTVGTPRPDVPLVLPSFVDLVGPGSEMTLVKCVCDDATVAVDGTNAIKGISFDNSLVFTSGITVDDNAVLVLDDIDGRFNGPIVDRSSDLTGNDVALDVRDSFFSPNTSVSIRLRLDATVRIDGSEFVNGPALAVGAGSDIVITDTSITSLGDGIQFQGRLELDGVDIDANSGAANAVVGIEDHDMVIRNSRLDNADAALAQATIRSRRDANTIVIENSVIVPPTGGAVLTTGNNQAGGTLTSTWNNNYIGGTIEVDVDNISTCTGTAKADGTFLTTGCP